MDSLAGVYRKARFNYLMRLKDAIVSQTGLSLKTRGTRLLESYLTRLDGNAMKFEEQLGDLLSAIRDDPVDDASRLRLAAWLEQQVDPRGEFIRLQCSRTCEETATADDPWAPGSIGRQMAGEPDSREEELLAQHGEAWIGCPPSDIYCVFHRGLLHVSCDAEHLLTDAAIKWLHTQRGWLASLFMGIKQDQELERLVDGGFLQQLISLDVYFWEAENIPHPLSKLMRLRDLRLSGSLVTDDWLEPLRVLKNLRSLELRGTEIHGEGLSHLTQLPKLNRLSISSCYQFTEFAGLATLKQLQLLWITYRNQMMQPSLVDSLLEAIHGLTGLQAIRLGWESGGGATEVGLRCLKGLNELKSLQLEISDNASLQPLANVTSLQELRLYGKGSIDSELAHLENLVNLRRLYIGISTVMSSGLRHLSQMDKLETLVLPTLRVLDANMQQFVGRTVPESLTLAGSAITDASLSHLVGLSQIERLDLREAAITGWGLSYLGELSQLSELLLYVHQLFDARPEDLARLTSLRKLQLSRKWKHEFTLEAMAGFKDLSQLCIDLDLDHIDFDDAELAHLAGLKQITYLNLSNDTTGGISDMALSYLSELSNLKELDLRGTQITESGLFHLAGLTELESLNLGQIAIAGPGLASLVGLRKLKTLKMDHCGMTDAGAPYLSKLTNLENLDLYRSQITDNGIAQLVSLSRLRYLNLAYSQVTDAGLRALSNLRQLEILWLGETSVTRQGADSLQEALPDCDIRVRFG